MADQAAGSPKSHVSSVVDEFESNFEENEKLKLMFKEFYAEQSKKKKAFEVSYTAQ